MKFPNYVNVRKEKVSDKNRISVFNINISEPECFPIHYFNEYTYEYGIKIWRPNEVYSSMWQPIKVITRAGSELNLTRIVSDVARTVVFFFGATGFEIMTEIFSGVDNAWLLQFFNYYLGRATSPIDEIESYLISIGYITKY